jgi:hypothetical protein
MRPVYERYFADAQGYAACGVSISDEFAPVKYCTTPSRLAT